MPSVPQSHDPPADRPDSSFRHNPLEHVRYLYTRFIQLLFWYHEPGYMHWDADDQQTEIYITNELPIKEEKLQMRPGITFTRSPVLFYSLGFNDDQMHVDMRTGAETKSVLIMGSMSINCVSRVPLESEHIAFHVGDQIWAQRKILIKTGFFEVGRQIAVGSPSPAGSIVAGDSADEYFVTTVSSPFQFQRTTIVTPIGVQYVGGFNVELKTGKPKNYNPQGVLLNNINGNLPFQIDRSVATEASSRSRLPVMPHPLNPAQSVFVKEVRRGGARSSTDALVPITRDGVEESASKPAPPSVSFKV